jgi:hypothetical protein
MNHEEAFKSLQTEGMTPAEAEAELTAARRGKGEYLSWSLRRGYAVRFI